MLVLSFHHVGGAGITGVRQQTLLPTEPIFSTHNMILYLRSCFPTYNFDNIRWDFYSPSRVSMTPQRTFFYFFLLFIYLLAWMLNFLYPLVSVCMDWWPNKLRKSILFCSWKTCIYSRDLSENLHKMLVSTAEIINSSESEMINCLHSSRQFFYIDLQELRSPQLVSWIKMHHWC